MGTYRDSGKVFTTSNFDFSSDAQYGVSSGNNSSDCFVTTSVGLGNITTGMVVTFYQSSGGTVAAGITSGTEYVVGEIVTVSSAFKVYAFGGSSAVEVTADSTGTDYWVKVSGGTVLDVRDAKYATLQVTPTTGWDGEFRFLGSMYDSMDSSGRVSSSNPLIPVAYRDMGASSYPTIGTTYADTTGGTATSQAIYRIDCGGLNYLTMRTRNHIAGAIDVDSLLYRE